jgi:hypothetical protein
MEGNSIENRGETQRRCRVQHFSPFRCTQYSRRRHIFLLEDEISLPLFLLLLFWRVRYYVFHVCVGISLETIDKIKKEEKSSFRWQRQKRRRDGTARAFLIINCEKEGWSSCVCRCLLPSRAKRCQRKGEEKGDKRVVVVIVSFSFFHPSYIWNVYSNELRAGWRRRRTTRALCVFCVCCTSDDDSPEAEEEDLWTTVSLRNSDTQTRNSHPPTPK